jgi:dTDP-4-amino-4,6-dideoxygalactose transaminase
MTPSPPIRKCRFDELAIVGGPPTFLRPLHVGLPNFGEPADFFRRVESMLASRRFTNDGPLVREFEDRIAAMTGAPHCIATCNATSALQLLARALSLSGEVALPSFTFVATAHAFSWLGLEPVFCDIDQSTHGLDPTSLEETIEPRCCAIVAVHTWGISCDVGTIETVARRHRLPLIYDAAHALGASHGERELGSLGDASVFSFHATKVAHSFEGGAITTSCSELARTVRRMRNFGFADDGCVSSIGTNAKLSELHAAAGLTMLEALPHIIEENHRCFDTYRRLLASIPGVQLLAPTQRGRSNYQYIVLEMGGDDLPAARDDLICTLHAEGIYARRYFHPGCHRLAPYAERARSRKLPVTERLTDRVVVLPTGPSVSDAAIEAVVEAVRLVLADPERVRAALGTRGLGVTA